MTVRSLLVFVFCCGPCVFIVVVVVVGVPVVVIVIVVLVVGVCLLVWSFLSAVAFALGRAVVVAVCGN